MVGEADRVIKSADLRAPFGVPLSFLNLFFCDDLISFRCVSVLEGPLGVLLRTLFLG
jgi:hypothetical protein